MTLGAFILAVVIVGLLLWAINALIPMQPQVKTFLNIAVIIILILWFVNLLGGFGSGIFNTRIH